jgi:O-antigen/teichoic acid export membrane protein
MHLHDEGMLTYSKHLSIMGIITGIGGNLDQILLFHFVGAAQLAVYNFATAIPDQIKGISKTLDAMLQARLVGRSGSEIKSAMKNKVFWYFILALICVVAYIVFAPYIFSIFFPSYMDSVWYSQIYALWILTTSFDPYGTYITAKKLILEGYIIDISYSIVQIIGMVIGVLYWGILGLIVARVVTRLVIAALNYILYRTAIERKTIASS